MLRVEVAPRCKLSAPLLSVKLSRTSLNEAMLQSQERSECDVSSEWSQVPGLALEKEDFEAYMASKMHRHQVEP